VRTYLGGAVGNGPLTISVDDFLAKQP
jgi:hypothetical protein